MTDVAPDAHEIPDARADRRRAVVGTAQRAGLFEGDRGAVGARLHTRLVEAAKARTGLSSTTEVLEYALAKVALEDDYGAKLLALKGKVPADLDLGI
jgi:hypothetical protein